MEAVTLSDLWPIIVAVLGPMLLCVTALARYQHVDSTKTRKMITDSEKTTLKLITDSNEKYRDLVEKTRDETRDLIEESSRQNRDLIGENRRLIEKNRDLLAASHAELSGSLTDARERLARIEGYLRIPPPPHQGAGDGDGNAKAA